MVELKLADFYKVNDALSWMRTFLEQKRKQGGAADKTKEKIGSTKDPVTKSIKKLSDSLASLDVPITLMAVQRVMEKVDTDKLTFGELEDSLQDISERLADELSLVSVYVLERDKCKYYTPVSPLFGGEVETKFPNMIFEIDEAGKCLGLDRPTASVFHLMRLMEGGLEALRICLGVPDPIKGVERNWGVVLGKLKTQMIAKDKASSWLPNDKHFFEDSHASVDAVKNAWRNSTMHVENKYNPEEAEHIFVAVKGFMKKIASRMDEQGLPLA